MKEAVNELFQNSGELRKDEVKLSLTEACTTSKGDDEPSTSKITKLVGIKNHFGYLPFHTKMIYQLYQLLLSGQIYLIESQCSLATIVMTKNNSQTKKILQFN